MENRANRILQKVENNVIAGKFYEAQQMYKTLFFRYTSQNKFQEAINLLDSGAQLFLQYNRNNEGTELANMLINLLNTTHSPVTNELIEIIQKITESYQTQDPGRRIFLKKAIKWSSNLGDNKEGDPRLHNLIAAIDHQAADYGMAQKHYLRGSQPEQFAQALLEWSREGFPSEEDLYIARAVFQYLALRNLRDANIVFEIFTKNCNNKTSPLLNFVRFLLMTLERDAYPLFQRLRERYMISLKRDSSFSQYLDQIGQVYFNVKPRSEGFGILGDLMKSFLGGNDKPHTTRSQRDPWIG